MPSYPSHFPLPDTASYGGVSDPGLIRSTSKTLAPKQTADYNSPVITLGFKFHMPNDLYPDWIQWAKDYGWNWFDIPVMSPFTPDNIMSTHRVRMISDIEYVKEGHGYLAVSVTVEMVTGDYEDPALGASVRIYDFISAESPSAPPPDYIEAGGPGTASTDMIEANIYKYDEESP